MRFFLYPLFVLCSITLIAQPPSNDQCSNAINLGNLPNASTCNTVYSNVNATLSMITSNPLENAPTCFNGAQRDVWFSFQIPVGAAGTNYKLTLTGVGGPGVTITNPQVAIYIGDCGLDNLIEVDCKSAVFGQTSLTMDLTYLQEGLVYYLRVNDYSANLTPQWGQFTLCITEFDPTYTLGTDSGSTSCSGVVYDSGGPNGNYSNSQNQTFTICPSASFACLNLNLVSYNLESSFDFLRIFNGSGTGGAQLAQFSGTGGPIAMQVSNCVTLQFISDNSVVQSGFELSWSCSLNPCSTPPATDCASPVLVSGLPYSQTGLTTFGAGNPVTPADSPCASDNFLSGTDMVFAYNSPGSECVKIQVNSNVNGTGIALYEGCPYQGGTCVRIAQSSSVNAPVINNQLLADPGLYYIVIAAPNSFTNFNISIDTVTCDLILPYAGYCSDNLSINGCPQDVPSIVQVAPGTGDPNWNTAQNNGCIINPSENYTFLRFQAQTNGVLAFTLQSAILPQEASDIDFNIWGPYDNQSDLCTQAAVTEPVRSSYAPGADPTGLQAVHPVSGIAVTDLWDCNGNNDDFVAPLPVVQGKWYLILIDDFGGAVEQGGISVNFANTTPGVLGPIEAIFAAGDTAICAGQFVQLYASGGQNYLWSPNQNINCTTCDTVFVNPQTTTQYTVNILTTCAQYNETVKVEILSINDIPDETICGGLSLQFNAGPVYGSATYSWQTVPAGLPLSCTDCPNPIFTSDYTQPGQKQFIVSLNAPGCILTDTFTITVLPNQAPIFPLLQDTAICVGQSLTIGAPPVSGQTYAWGSLPPSFTSTNSSITVSPTATTTYYVAVANGSCPFPLVDSIVVSVGTLPALGVIADVTVCPNSNLSLLNSVPGQPGVVYTWTPATYLNNPNIAQPSASNIGAPITYFVTANNNGCVRKDTLNISIQPGGITIANGDSVNLCKGQSVVLTATSTAPTLQQVNWSSIPAGVSTTGSTFNYTPNVSNKVIAAITLNGCTFRDTITVKLDSLPANLTLLPSDTSICLGDTILLTSDLYNPVAYPNLQFNWSVDPSAGNIISHPQPQRALVSPTAPGTYIYVRQNSNGACSSTHTAVVNAKPVVDLVVSPQTANLCAGSQLTLNASSTATQTFNWSAPPGVLSCTDCANPVATPTVTMVVTVTAVSTVGGCNNTQQVTLNVLPLAQPVFPDDTELCPGQSVVLNSGDGLGSTFSWSGSNGFTSTDVQPTVSPTAPTTYTVTVSNGSCSTVSSVLIDVAQASLLVSTDTVICLGETVNLTAVGSVPGSYVWLPDGQNTQAITVTPLSTTLYQVIYTFGDDCTLSDSVTVMTAEPFEVNISATPDVTSVFQGQPIVLTANVISGNPNLPSFVWSENQVSLPQVTPSITVTPLVDPSIYTVTVSATNGCSKTATLTLEVLIPDIQLPNTFTPNGDGTNDIFKLILGNGVPVNIKSFKVYNRWGAEVYAGQGTNAGWDGRIKGVEQPSDVYNYIITVVLGDGSEKSYQGELLLIR